ncbi:solute carrier organic anion transporter family member 1C1-like isoform X2 [Hemicordylus capensis]|uniref:solute carrier organic anion transporter family member 1C1-like isoform X2 n=1 Tax=Hemicordylus capensis TaxID=884348 RepID=UPI0023026A42|nr:solute carrier organic anion transporter family member 1C1-like isoform X2 [Hemicordylus capensis]
MMDCWHTLSVACVRPKHLTTGQVHSNQDIVLGCTSSHPPFLRYNYKSIALSMFNTSTSISACSSARPPPPHHAIDDAGTSGNSTTLGCEKVTSSYLWLFVLAGNLLRGIGESPIMPLGMSYIDDFATEENSAFYIGTVRSCGMFGPTLGFLLGAFCASLWVDIGLVDVDTLIINSKDVRWVGAWWLGFLICGAVSIMASLPFWFLPSTLPKQGEEGVVKRSSEVNGIAKEKNGKMETPKQTQLKVSGAVTEFFLALKKLLGNIIFLVFLLINILQYNSMVGLITYESKFMEQQFNVSVSKAIFLIGVIILPITIVGMFLGGLLVKKFKLNIMGMAKFACITFLTAYVLNWVYFVCNCEVLQVAGLTVNYSGIREPSFVKEKWWSTCNSDCGCEANHWDPVCGDNGITYMSACLAGCKASVGTGKDMVFHNCSCVGAAGPANLSAVLGQCPRDHCAKAFPYFVTLLSICAFIICLGATPMYMVLFRSVSPDLKSFAVGIETLCGRILGGLPAPIYFGALIDKTCLKWGTKTCGGSGSCRVYDTVAFRNIYLGLILALRAGCCFLYIVLFILIRKQFKQDKEMNATKSIDGPPIKLPVSDKNKGEPSCMEMTVHEDTYF